MATRPLVEGMTVKGGLTPWPSQVIERPVFEGKLVTKYGFLFSSPWALGDIVNIDGDASLKGHVTAVQFRRTNDPLIEVSYVFNGDAKAHWFEAYRLSRAD